jgi:hypothetical protein
VVALALLRPRLDPLPAPQTVASKQSANSREAIAIASHQGTDLSAGVARRPRAAL